jgi:hypothetical protein
MRLIGTLVLFGTIALLWKGGQGVYEAVGNTEPTELSCAELEKTPPATGWFRLTGCVADLLDASYRKSGSEVTEIFIPAYPAGVEKPDKIHLVVATEDPELSAFMEEMASVDESRGTGAALQVLAKHADKLRVTRNFQGMVQAGIDKSDMTKCARSSLACKATWLPIS